MASELVFGDSRAIGPDGTVHRPASEIGSSDETSSRVRLDTPLEELRDPWPVLRAIWDRVLPGGTLIVTFGGRPVGPQPAFRLAAGDVDNLLRLAGFEPVARTPPNGYREVTARRLERRADALSCSVVIPCRNEVDNVDGLITRAPRMGTDTEIIFVDGASTDGTPEKIEEVIKAGPDRDVKLVRQEGDTGKAGATFQGFAAAEGEVVMILDADMTVRPEDLPRFYLALAERVAEFANGTRLVYPMEPGAMPDLNLRGNRVFSVYLSWLLGQRITDTLCGTKAVLRRNVPELLKARRLFGGHDPWGDFDLLLGAGRLGLEIIEVPIRYVAREAGESKMRPWQHGLALSRTCALGAWRLKLERRFAKPGRG